jgi:DNA invertase Pin-like site-specific DNA recombinase
MTVEEVLQKHEKILNEWCERNVGEIISDSNTFRELGSAETIQARPEFQKILRLIESPKYKAILCIEVQRLSRGDLEDAGRLMKLLRYTNTFVITPDRAFDLNDEDDRERFKRELERGNDYLEYYKKINWRGRLESVRAGYYIGSVAPFGYDKDTILDGRKKRPTLKINEREAEAVRLMFDLYVNHDLGLFSIAHRLTELGFKTRKGDPWNSATIKDMLTNVHYTGKIKWNERKTVNVVIDGEISKTRPKTKDFYIFDGKHPAIIDEELFERVKEKLGKNNRKKFGTQLRNPLASLAYCRCGKAMVYRTYKNIDGKELSAPRLMCNNQAYCHTQSVTYDDMINKVSDVLKACISDFEIKIKNDSENTLINHTNLINHLESKLEELNRKELSQWEKYSEEGMPKAIFDKLNEKVLQEKETVTKALETARVSAPTVESYQEKLKHFTDALNGLHDPNVSAEAKNRLLKACIERIEYTREAGNRWHSTDFELDITLKV